jgi:hypothetical protein
MKAKLAHRNSIKLGTVRWIVTFLCACCGAALLLALRGMDAAWFEHHIVQPCYYLAPAPGLLRKIHWTFGIAGGLFLAAAWPLGRWISGGPLNERLAAMVRIAIAASLGLVAAEIILRASENHTTLWRADKLEFVIGRADARFGWVFLPSHSWRMGARDHKTNYFIDAWGDRAQSEKNLPDPRLPTLIVSGESTAVGHAVEYEQTFAALMGKDLGLQVVNTAAGGYGADQALLRVEDAISRLQQPRAVAVTFLPVMLSRAVQDYRTRFVLRDGGLALAPPASSFFAHLRLRDFFVNEVPYVSESSLAESRLVTAAVLRRTAESARAHGAAPVFIAISLGPQRPLDEHAEAAILRQLFVDQSLPWTLVDVEASELVPWDGHPGPAAHRKMASAAVAVLRAEALHGAGSTGH